MIRRFADLVNYISSKDTPSSKALSRHLAGPAMEMSGCARGVKQIHSLSDQRRQNPAEYIAGARF